MNDKAVKWIAAVALALGLGMRLLLALDHAHFNPLFDDSYYALDVARSIAAGKGVTCGGIHTNGFQPLFVLLAVPFYRLFAGHDAAAVHGVLALLAILNTVAGWLLYGFIRALKCPRGAVLGLIAWCLSPYVIWHGVNGLETGLTAVCVFASGWYYVARIRAAASWRPLELAGLGALLGLGVLSRVDMGFWAVALALDMTFFRREIRVSRRLAGTALVGVVAVVVASPWFLFNMLHFGSPLPTSGAGVRFISLAYGYKHWGRGGAYLSGDGVPLKYYALSLRASLREIFTALDLLSTSLTLRGMLAALAVAAVVSRRRLAEYAVRYPFLALFPLLQIVAYSFWIFGQWFYPRYYYTVAGVAVIWICALADRALAGTTALRRTAVFAGLGIYLLLLPWDAIPQKCLRRAFHSRERDADLARAVEDIVPEGVAVGAFQSGALAYYTRDRRIVNLDGVINRAALAAMKEKRMTQYLRGEGIDWLMDWDWIIEALYARRAGVPDPMAEWELVKSWGKMGLYRRK
ncbi:MAG: hypothetical protein FJ276_32800 [Planctomycetes bacterium]|nr:hypothetical protein [Planctomycetota bacterium]